MSRVQWGTLARITDGSETYLHPDHLGNVQSGTKGNGYSTAELGEVALREQYTPFGEQIQNPAANDNLDGFTGHIKDKATGLNPCILRICRHRNWTNFVHFL